MALSYDNLAGTVTLNAALTSNSAAGSAGNLLASGGSANAYWITTIAQNNTTLAASALQANSIAIGANAWSNAVSSVVIGANSVSNNAGVAIGANTRNLNSTGVAIGDSAYNWAANGVAIGAGAVAGNQRATALGEQTTALFYGAAVGSGANAYGRSVAIGAYAAAGADAGTGNAVAVGVSSAAANQATAVGFSASAAGSPSTAVGNGAKANNVGSLSLGSTADANANYAVAIGHGTVTSTANEIKLGANGSFIVNIPGSVSVNASIGTAGQVLASGGSGANAYWLTVSGGATLNANNTDTATYYLPMSSTTSGSWSNGVISNTKLYFVPSTGTLNATIFNSLSDRHFKENITAITDALATVNRLNGVGFHWVDTKLKSYGVIADDIEKQIPEIVATNADGIKSVNYQALSAFLIESIKQLTQRIEFLENK